MGAQFLTVDIVEDRLEALREAMYETDASGQTEQAKTLQDFHSEKIEEINELTNPDYPPLLKRIECLKMMVKTKPTDRGK